MSIVLIFSHFWSFTLFSIQFYKLLEMVAIGYMVTICILKRRSISIREMHFWKYVLWFMLLPWLSIIPAYFVHEQSPLLSAYMLRYELVWLFYFVLHIQNPPPEDILKLVVWFAVIWACLLLVQQVTYPYYWFATRGANDFMGNSVEVRNGVYRYATTGYSIALIALFYSFQRMILGKKRRFLQITIFTTCLVGVYLLMTRQLLFAVAVSLAIANLYVKQLPYKVRITVGILLAGVLVFSFSDALFGVLLTKTQAQFDDNIRYQSSHFFLFEYWQSFLDVVFGNGVEHESSKYGQELLFYKTFYGYYRSDVGIIGKLNGYGLLYVLAFILFSFNLFFKYFKHLFLYQKLFFIASYIPLLMIFPLTNSFSILAFVLVLYLCDYAISYKDTEV